MPAKLIERPLLVSPSLAATIGLQPALLYQLLVEWQQMQSGQISEGRDWYLIDKERLLSLLPFWTIEDIENILRQLQDQGLIIIGAALIGNARNIRFALNSGKAPTPEPAPAHAHAPTIASPPAASTQSGASPIRGNWRPDQESLAYLQRLGVDAGFIDTLIPEFIAHWRDSGEARISWNSTFIQHAMRRWRKYRYEQVEEANTIQLDRDWQPSADAAQILQRSGIDTHFIQDAVPEFILYWRERGTFDRNWNSRFVEHVRRQWAYYTNAMRDDAQPAPLPADWQPSSAVFDILRMANIDTGFARDLVPEFVLYWRDSQQIQRSWNSKFLQHIKYRWAQTHELGYTDARQSLSTGKAGSESAKIFQKLTDRSWAEGLIGKGEHER